MTFPLAQLQAAGIDTSAPFSDGWWLKRLYEKLRVQQKRCQLLYDRYSGNPPLPMIATTQSDAVRWFVRKSRSNYERLIVQAVLSRCRIIGLRTGVDHDEGGDAEAFKIWKAAHMKLVVAETTKMCLAMSLAYQIIGKDADGDLLVTAEDPRLCTAITDPANPYKVLAGLKLFHDDVADEDVAYLYLPGRARVARRPRKAGPGSADVRFNPAAYLWDDTILNDLGEVVYQGSSPGVINELADFDDNGDLIGGRVPMTVFENEDGMAEFEPHIEVLDRINQQILQRMTIATVQAFKQRAFKGLPKTDEAGHIIDYNAIFTADPGAVWNLPAGVEVWESGTVDLGPILQAIRDDVKELAANSGTPLYSITPDASQGSAEGASLQRETNTFKVEARQDRWEPAHEHTAETMFMMIGDQARGTKGNIEIIWAPAERYSMSERANAIAQTKGVISRYNQATMIFGMDPDQADRNMSELTDDLIVDSQYAAAAKTLNATPASLPVQ